MSSNVYFYIRIPVENISVENEGIWARDQALLYYAVYQYAGEDLKIKHSNIYYEKQKGKYLIKEKYNELMSRLSKGDLLITDSIGGLGRDYTEIKKEWHRITKEIEADIVIVKFGDDTQDAFVDTRLKIDAMPLDKFFDMIIVLGSPVERLFRDLGLSNLKMTVADLVESESSIADIVYILLCGIERGQKIIEKERATQEEQAAQEQRVKVAAATLENKEWNEEKMRIAPALSQSNNGRPKIAFPENWLKYYNAFMNKKITATQAMKELGLKRNTFYKLKSRFEYAKNNPEFKKATKGLSDAKRNQVLLKYAMSIDYALVKEQEKHK